MGLMDTLLLTTSSTVLCLAFPKLLSMILSNQTNRTKPDEKVSTSPIATSKITAFPYCTSYILTGSPSCRFSPHFCAKCSLVD